MFQALQRFAERLRKPKSQPKRLEIIDDGLALFESGREVCRFRWADVSKVETYKRDLFSVDMICLDFSLDAGQMVYTAHDEMDGFSELSSHLTRYFPSIAPDWWSEVAFPAFATKHRICMRDRHPNKREHRTPDPPRVSSGMTTAISTNVSCRAPGPGPCVL
jgi:hypothetical protein